MFFYKYLHSWSYKCDKASFAFAYLSQNVQEQCNDHNQNAGTSPQVLDVYIQSDGSLGATLLYHRVHRLSLGMEEQLCCIGGFTITDVFAKTIIVRTSKCSPSWTDCPEEA